MYQFLVNTADEDVKKYLKILTLIPLEEIEEIVKKHFEKPENRYAQKILAFKVTEIIHWTEEAQLAEKLSEFLFWDEDKIQLLASLSKEQLRQFQKEVWWKVFENEDLLDLLVKVNLSPSRSQAKKDIKAGAIYMNEQKISNIDSNIEFKDNICLLRKWKKKYAIITKV